MSVAAPTPGPAPGALAGTALVAALDFLRQTSAGGTLELGRWHELHLVSTGRMFRSRTVTEVGFGTVPLPSSPSRPGIADQQARLAHVARERVLYTLRRFRLPIGDDRFLAAAILAGRVRRIRVGHQARWEARLAVGETLSNIVLALFAADILSEREKYESSLCICDVCGAVWFDAVRPRAARCTEHAGGTVGRPP